MYKTRAMQARIFEYEDLPIFTGTAPVGQVEQSAATIVSVSRPSLFAGTCAICLGTGTVGNRPCICGKATE